jgi:hypothetical protein
MLRRTKRTELGGKAIVELAERNVELITLTFTPSERAFYDDLEQQSRKKLQVFI